MPILSRASKDKISTCCGEIITLTHLAIDLIDFTVICGYRNNIIQDQLYSEGKSRAKAGQSKHNKWPSDAIDVAPYPVDWKDIDRFIALGGVLRGIAKCYNFRLRWGGDWDGDWNFKNEVGKLRDYGHFEIVR